MAEKELEIEQNLAVQRKRLGARKFMWIIFAIILIAACAGWIGGRGLWATVDTTSDNGTFKVQYSKFDRMKAPTSVQINIPQTTATQTKLAISDSYLKSLGLRYITPQPDSVAAAQGQTIYTFDTKPGKDLHVYFNLEFQNFGWLKGNMERLDTHDHITIKQIVFP